MKKSEIIIILLFACSGFLCAQAEDDVLDENTIFAPLSNDIITPKESWEIHKAKFIKKLEKEGATKEDIKKRLVDYEKEKAEYIAKVKTNFRLDEIKRKKGAELREEEDAWRKNYELLLSQNITLSKDNQNVEPISFELDSETTISFGVRGHISLGFTQLILYNPYGKIEAKLKLEYDPHNTYRDHDLTFTSGSLDKKIAGAKPGVWQVKIISKNASGYIAFSVSLKKQ